MIKYLIIGINSLLFFIYGLFSGDNGITVTGKISNRIIVAQETEVEIRVYKGSQGGFAKLQLEMPTGFTVLESDYQGASYTFEAGTAKWVWAVLPSQEEIIIKLKVMASEDDLGLKMISAKYSYVENNVKQVVEMDPIEITVLEVGDKENISEKVPEPVVENTEKLPEQVTSNIENPGEITAIRKVEEGSSANEKIVTVIINKGLTKGFARYSDELPANVTVKSTKTDGASFSLADGKIKFVWVNVPSQEKLEVAYSISGSVTPIVNLKGEYSYLEDNQSKKFTMPAATLNFQLDEVPEKPAEPIVIAKEEVELTAEPEPKKPEVAKEEPKPVVKKEEEKVLAKETKKQALKKAIDIKPADGGKLKYCVQIGAFSRKKVTTAVLEKKFKVSETISSEMQAGYNKFLVGSHIVYKEARDHRETVISNNGIKSAFVVAYNQGKRITVQEALMITNQSWYK